MTYKLSLISILGLALMIVHIILIGPRESKEIHELTFLQQILFVWGFMGGLAIWILMLSDFFREKELQHKVIWGWALILGSYLSAVIYFLFVYHPRYTREKAST